MSFLDIFFQVGLFDQDISMWIPEEFVDNDLFEMIRDEGGDQVGKTHNFSFGLKQVG